MRDLSVLFILLAVTLPLQAAFGQSDVRLTQLMVGAWRSPRHDYIYSPDGTWSMGRPEPGIAHGRWRIRDGHLVESITCGDDKGPKPNIDHGAIQKLTRREILFGDVFRMERVAVEDVEADQ